MSASPRDTDNPDLGTLLGNLLQTPQAQQVLKHPDMQPQVGNGEVQKGIETVDKLAGTNMAGGLSAFNSKIDAFGSDLSDSVEAMIKNGSDAITGLFSSGASDVATDAVSGAATDAATSAAGDSAAGGGLMDTIGSIIEAL